MHSDAERTRAEQPARDDELRYFEYFEYSSIRECANPESNRELLADYRSFFVTSFGSLIPRRKFANAKLIAQHRSTLANSCLTARLQLFAKYIANEGTNITSL